VPKHVGAALVINALTKPSALCWFSMHKPAIHGTNIKQGELRKANVQCIPQSWIQEKYKINVYQPHSNNIDQLHNSTVIYTGCVSESGDFATLFFLKSPDSLTRHVLFILLVLSDECPVWLKH
jgi:hypothetical protein